MNENVKVELKQQVDEAMSQTETIIASINNVMTALSAADFSQRIDANMALAIKN